MAEAFAKSYIMWPIFKLRAVEKTGLLLKVCLIAFIEGLSDLVNLCIVVR